MKNKKTLTIVVLALLLAMPTAAQEVSASTEADKASREDVLQFLDAMQIRPQMEKMNENMKLVIQQSAESALAEMGDLTAEEAGEFQSIVADSMPVLKTDEVIDALIPIYQKHLTRTEMLASVEFYSSPVGKSLLEKMPALMQDSMQIGVAMAQEQMKDLKPAMNLRIKALSLRIAERRKNENPEGAVEAPESPDSE